MLSGSAGWRLGKVRRVQGFTLIEMLVVMVLLGLATGLALPAMQRWHDAVLARTKVTSVVEALRAAMFAAAAQRKDIVMDEQSFPVASSAAPAASGGALMPSRAQIALPAGWRVARVVPAAFLGNGLCRPGMAVLLTDANHRLVLKVEGPVCGVETVADVAQAMH